MAEGGFDDFEMKELGDKYPEYSDMDYDELHTRYGDLTKELYGLGGQDSTDLGGETRIDLSERVSFLDDLFSDRSSRLHDERETTFTDRDSGKTVTIRNKNNVIVEDAIPNMSKDSGVMRGSITRDKKIAIKEFLGVDIHKNYGPSSKALVDAVTVTFGANGKTSGLTYKGAKVVVYKDGEYNFSTSKRYESTTREFKDLVYDAKSEISSRKEIESAMPMVDVEHNELEGNTNPRVITGLSPNETRDLRGVLFPSDTIDRNTRIGPKGVLQTEIDHISETIRHTEGELDRTEDLHARESLEERIGGLKEARDLVSRQKQHEEVREQQDYKNSRSGLKRISLVYPL